MGWMDGDWMDSAWVDNLLLVSVVVCGFVAMIGLILILAALMSRTVLYILVDMIV